MEEITSQVAVNFKCPDSPCRTCLCDLKEAVTFNVNDLLVPKLEDNRESTETLTIGEVLSRYVFIQIYTEDNLSKILCQQCFTDLTYVYEFIKKCQKSDEILRSASLNSNETVTEIKIEEFDDFSPEIKDNVVEETDDTKPATEEPTDSESTSTDEKTTERRFKCEICPKAYIKKQSLIIHQRTHTDELPFTCQYCGRGFNQASNMKAHTKTHYHKPENGHSDANPPPKPKRVRSAEFECSICKQHLFSKESLKDHKRIHKEKTLLCSYCGEKFRTKYTLEVHIRVHTNEKPYACKYCGKAYKQRGSLRIHTYTHTGEKPHSCEICGKRFTQMWHLKGHVLRQHDKVKPHACRYCDRSFTMRTDLRIHERIHTGERPFVCEVCGKGFYSSSTRTEHMRVHRVRGNGDVNKEEDS